ncbi:MAG: cupin domain-containing protein [Actinobacteria bacterium]|nr:cupin domain-containing protein [Actinomycetota bacterium]
MTNVFRDDWDATDDWSGGGAKSKRLVERGPLLGASLYELGPGNSVVYHFHHGSEELLIVLKGRPTLRTPEGERQVAEGAVVHFPLGPDGTHGLRNDSDGVVRYLVAGIRVSPEVAEYPDLNKITAQARTNSQNGEPLFVIHDLDQGNA